MTINVSRIGMKLAIFFPFFFLHTDAEFVVLVFIILLNKAASSGFICQR